MPSATHRATKPIRPNRLAVILAGEQIAWLEHTKAGSMRLTYLPDAGIAGTPISLSLPRGMTHTGAAVERFVAALLPEDKAARDAIGRQHRVDARDNLALLGAIGQDCPGALQFCTEDAIASTLNRAEGLEPLTESDIEARLAALEMDESASWTMPNERWSLGGTQQKFALRWEDSTWNVATGAEPTSHIVKPGIRTMRAQALVEHVTMAAASALGIPTAHTAYTEFKSQSALVVERFDRARVDGRLTRLHQEDLCQALGMEQKYEDQGGPSAAMLARALRESSTSATNAKANTAAFVDMLVFNTVVAAPDAHGRNYAILLDGDRVTLAPMFDAATGLAHATSAQRSVAMSIGGQRRLGDITAENWRRLAQDIEVDERHLFERVAHLSASAPTAFEAALAATDNPEVAELRERLMAPLQAMTSFLAASVNA